MKKLAISLVTGISLLTLTACSSGNSKSNDTNKPSKTQIQKQELNKTAKSFQKNANDKTYYKFVQTALGKDNVKKLKTASNHFKVVQLNEGKFTSDSKYNKFGKGVAIIIKTVKDTSYAKPGIGFIQLDSKDSTQFVFAYNTRSLNKFKFEKLGLDDHGDQAIGKATSYYIEPFFAQDSTSMSMDEKVKIGQTDPQTKEGLNNIIMDSFE